MHKANVVFDCFDHLFYNTIKSILLKILIPNPDVSCIMSKHLIMCFLLFMLDLVNWNLKLYLNQSPSWLYLNSVLKRKHGWLKLYLIQALHWIKFNPSKQIIILKSFLHLNCFRLIVLHKSARTEFSIKRMCLRLYFLSLVPNWSRNLRPKR